VAEDKPDAPARGVAHIPATVLTVEYVDDGEGMSTALKSLDSRLASIEQRVKDFEDKQSRLIAAVNQQAKDIGRYMQSLGRRIDQLYKQVTGGSVELPDVPQQEAPAAGPSEHNWSLDETAASLSLPPDLADNEEHQNAWRIARVLAADLEAYHEDAVREGVIYGTFFKLLQEPIEKASKTYEERVPAEIVENYDYFSNALAELIARKRLEIGQTESP